MSKKSKKNKKISKGSKAKAFLLNKKTITYGLSFICAILVITGICIGVRTYKKRIADRTVKVAFYGLDENLTELLKAQIPQEENIILQLDTLSDKDFDLQIVKEKYDMLFTWRGEITDTLAKSAEDIPAKILEQIPNSLRNKKCIPIILDHCEFAFSTEVLNRLNSDTPENYDAFIKYLNESKNYVFSPFFCNGANNRILIDFLGALVMSKGGLSAYNKLIDELRIVETLDEVIDIKLDGKDLTLRSLLDMLKLWPKEGLTHPAWYNGHGNDLVYFAEEKQISCFFTLLSSHRKIAYNIIKNYESAKTPMYKSGSDYGLIAPAVSCMLLSDNSNCKKYLAGFFTEEAQTSLSDKTALAPTQYRAESYDRQADDVRFWAASCSGGAVPDIYLAAYQRRSKELEKLCGEIRNYVR